MRSRPEVVVHYKPAVVHAGDEVTVDIDLQSPSSTPVDGITLTLSCKERFETGHLPEHVRTPVSLVARFPAAILHQGSHTRSAVLRLPQDAPRSLRLGAGQIPGSLTVEYELLVSVSIPWWPDVEKKFGFFVAPGPPPAPAPSPRVKGRLPWSRDDRKRIETWIDRAGMRAGEALSGHVLVPDLQEGEPLDIHVVFVAELTDLRERLAEATEIVRFHTPPIRRRPRDREAVDFEVVLPRVAIPTYESRFCRITWSVEVHVAAREVSARVATFPFVVVEAGDEAPVEPGSELVHLGAERRFALWSEIAPALGLVFDAEADRLTLGSGDVRLAISVEEQDGAQATVARIDWPSLGMDLRIVQRRLGDLFRDRIETGDEGLDRGLHIQAREPSQALALLTPDLRRLLIALPDIGLAIGDAGAELRIGGNGRDRATMLPFARRAGALAKGLEEALSKVPVPPALARFEEAWRAATGRLGGRLSPGGPWIHEGKWGDAFVELGIVWGPDRAVRGTVLRLRLDPPLPEAIDPATAHAKLTKRAMACLRSLEEKLGGLVLGPDHIEGTLPAAALDPEGTLFVFDEMAALSAALQGRFEGPYR